MYNGYIFGMSLLVGCAAGRSGDRRLFSTESGFRTALNGIYVELSNNALYGGELSVDAVEILAQRYDFSGNTTNAYRLGTYNYTIDYAKSKFGCSVGESLFADCQL